jgi:hypothetical protein
MTQALYAADALALRGGPHSEDSPDGLRAEGPGAAGALAVGTRVRVTTAFAPGCAPGDTGTVAVATVLGDGRALYHVQLDPARAGWVNPFYRPAGAGGVRCFCADEIERAG